MSEEEMMPLPSASRGWCGCGRVNRRTVLAGAAAAAGLAGVSAALAQDEAALPPQPGDFLVLAAGASPLTPQDIRQGSNAVEAFAMSPEGIVRSENFSNSVLLLRYDPAELPKEVATLSGEGVVAYSIICTHAGCPVNSRLEDGLIPCDCHGSRFDPQNNGAVAQGPALRKLPQLALNVADKALVVVEGFDSRVGGDMVGEDDR
jgi:rieske iron-sulfur protein